jgi:hypothetical protein
MQRHESLVLFIDPDREFSLASSDAAALEKSLQGACNAPREAKRIRF